MISKSEIEWYKKIMPELKTVFDVGCKNDNIFHTLNPELDIHLFDPIEYEAIGKFNNIALSDKKGHHIFFEEYGSMYKRDLKGEKWEWLQHNQTTIETETLDNYCINNKIESIDLLKIDTEGNDYKVLLGSKKMMSNIKYIQFEHWSNEMVKKVKILLKDWKIEPLEGRPMNYKCYK